MKLDAEHLSQATIAQIEAQLKKRGGAGRTVLALLEQDPRAGVRRLAVLRGVVQWEKCRLYR